MFSYLFMSDLLGWREIEEKLFNETVNRRIIFETKMWDGVGNENWNFCESFNKKSNKWRKEPTKKKKRNKMVSILNFVKSENDMQIKNKWNKNIVHTLKKKCNSRKLKMAHVKIHKSLQRSTNLCKKQK